MPRKKLFSHVVHGVELVALTREDDGRVLLTVVQPGVVELPVEAVKALGDSARYEALLHKDRGD